MDYHIDDPTLAKGVDKEQLRQVTWTPTLLSESNKSKVKNGLFEVRRATKLPLEGKTIAICLPLTADCFKLALLIDSLGGQPVVTVPDLTHIENKPIASCLVAHSIPVYAATCDGIMEEARMYRKVTAYEPDVVIDTNFTLTGFGFAQDLNFKPKHVIETNLKMTPDYLLDRGDVSAQWLLTDLRDSEPYQKILNALDYVLYWNLEPGTWKFDNLEEEWG